VLNSLDIEDIFIQHINANWVPGSIVAHVLRLDKIHAIVSGNKWFKLKYYLEEAKQQGHDTIATFGGAWSNHIVAAAFAARVYGFKSIGIIRGEQPQQPSNMLVNAAAFGMQLQFVTRAAYNDKQSLKKDDGHVYWINEGGYGHPGARGAGEITQLVKDIEKYSHIICAVGTGTMFAGLVNSAKPMQEVIGISVLKNNFSVEDEVRALLDDKAGTKRFTILHGFHFGGYAKHPPQLIEFMQATWQSTGLPTDIVYTAKTFYALQQLIMAGRIPAGSNVLMIHSGGLQGNDSLQKGVLPF